MQPDFSKNNGLLSVILQDFDTKQVLMNGFMNEEAFELTKKKMSFGFIQGQNNVYGKKGESSGNVQHVVEMTLDCDQDALLIQVIPAGPTCHLGNVSCFDDPYFNLEILEKTIQDRIKNPKEGSYTKYLLEQGLDKILKKSSEEMTETIIACKNQDKDEIISEASDLFYHVLLLLNSQEVSLNDIKENLETRHGKAHSYKRRKEITNW